MVFLLINFIEIDMKYLMTLSFLLFPRLRRTFFFLLLGREETQYLGKELYILQRLPMNFYIYSGILPSKIMSG